MKLKHRDPNHPEVVERVVRYIREMSPEETLKQLAWRPEGVEETWMLEESTTRKNGQKTHLSE
jgi:hypothetical protein